MILSSTETGILVRALDRAPSVHNTQPWELEVSAEAVMLHERTDVQLPQHDPAGRDRSLSCGAALANVELAMRALGHDVAVAVLPDAGRPELVAVLRPVGHASQDARADLYPAIFRRRSYRAPFSFDLPSRAVLRELAKTAEQPGVRVHVVGHGAETRAIADLLCYAGGVLHHDDAYQRELAAWSPRFPQPLGERTTMPWSGLVQATTHVPDRVTLYNRLAEEALFVLSTGADERLDHIRAGAALQRLWLAAVTEGMVGSVLTQPLQLAEVRLGVAVRLALPGHPQALLRVGYPVNGLPAQETAVFAGEGGHAGAGW